jgi:hypothetical protein
LTGCAGEFSEFGDRFRTVLPVRGNLVADGQVKTEVVPGPSLNVSPPSVQRLNDEIVISGTVSRRSGSNGDIPGFLALQVITPTGVLSDQLEIHWVPEVIPLNGSRTATYGARVLGLPQAGSIVRITYFESAVSLRSRGFVVGQHLPASLETSQATTVPAVSHTLPDILQVELSNVQIRLVSARIAKVKSVSEDGTEVHESVRPQLSIVLEVKNISDDKECKYSTWGELAPVADGNVVLSDDLGNSYEMQPYGFGEHPTGRVDSAQVPPGKKFTDVLVFSDIPNVGPASTMILELPARNVGETGVMRLQFPISMIQR